MKIAITAQTGAGNFEFLGEPWSIFLETLREMGHSIVDWRSDAHVLIMNNFSKSAFNIHRKLPKNRKILIVWEPPTNLFQNFKFDNLDEIGHKFFPSPIWARNYNGDHFPWPQGLPSISPRVNWQDKKDQFSLIQANRWSVTKGEQYSLRRKVLARCNDDIDVFGNNWNVGIVSDLISVMRTFRNAFESRSISLAGISGCGRYYQNVFGSIESKHRIQSQYKFSLVIENSREYVSEKIVDAILNETIPLYVGPSLETCGFNSGIALEVDPSVDSIASAIAHLKNDSPLCHRILEEGKRFLASRKYEQMINVTVLRNLALSIDQKICE